jgi:FtsH-binding integral membrane protein
MLGFGNPIWFFIGVQLLILAYGIFEWATGCYPPLVQMTNLHTPLWWGTVLAFFGLFYVVKFRPGRAQK